MNDLLETEQPWRELAEGSAGARRLLDEAEHADPREARDLARLKRDHPDRLVRAALEIVEARRRARGRLEDADSLIADVAGVEQATRSIVAAHKAARFRERGAAPLRVMDLACGIGSDARALARVGEVRAFDLFPARAYMTRRYAGCPAATADVTALDVRGELAHLDPSRRDETGRGSARRAASLDEMRPGRGAIERVIREARAGALKLGPGVDAASLPWRDETELEFVSAAGSLMTATVWFGGTDAGWCEPGAVRATRLPEGATVVSQDPLPAPVQEAGDGPARFVYAVDPALERARLLGAVDPRLREAHPGLGILTSDAAIASPWVERFEVAAALPWRIERVRDWLRANDGGHVEVKTRGGAVDALAAQRELNGGGATPYVVFGLRLGRKVVAWIARR